MAKDDWMTDPSKFCLEDVPGYGPKSMCMMLLGHNFEHRQTTDFGWADYNEMFGEAEGTEILAAENEAFDQRRLSKFLKQIPPKFHRAQLDDLDQPEEIVAEIRAWFKEGSGSLILLGTVGSGKTYAGVAVLRHLCMENDATAQMVSVVELFRKLRPEGGGRIEDYLDADYLLLDDLGIEKPSEWTEQILFDLVDNRWRNEKTFVVTSNLTPDQLKATVGARVWDRLRDDARAINLPGASKRKAAA